MQLLADFCIAVCPSVMTTLVPEKHISERPRRDADSRACVVCVTMLCLTAC